MQRVSRLRSVKVHCRDTDWMQLQRTVNVIVLNQTHGLLQYDSLLGITFQTIYTFDSIFLPSSLSHLVSSLTLQ